MYRLDAEDRFIEIGGAWDAFARENSSPHLMTSNVLGTPLRQWISCETTWQIYQAIFEIVRKKTKEVRIPYRCDGPNVRRFMELKITPDIEAGVKCQSFLLRREQRDTIRLLDPDAPRDNDFLSICGWCKQIEALPNQWMETERGVQVLRLFLRKKLPKLTHGICPTCEKHLERQLNSLDVESA